MRPISTNDYIINVEDRTRLGIVESLDNDARVMWTDGTIEQVALATLRRVKAPLGFVLYAGPSMIDGAPIVCIVNALQQSGNAKTGALVQSFILRDDVAPVAALRSGADASICGQCQHRPTLVAAAVAAAVAKGTTLRQARAAAPARCYVNVGRAPNGVFQAHRRGRYMFATVEFIALAVRGRRVRLGTYGDPAAIPVHYWQPLVAAAAAHTGYSHQWRAIDPRAWAPLVMASADSVAERAEARALGFRTFRVSVDASDLSIGSEISCPASKESGARVQCADCMLCGGTTKTARDIRILDHAPGWQSRRIIQLATIA